MFSRAIVRQVASTFERALTASGEKPVATRAAIQHARYVEVLRDLGLEITSIDADPACPDCCFVEDCAVVADGVALVTQPGAPSRRAETPAVRRVLERFVKVEIMDGDATLDGGDCLRVGRTFYVGRSARTNAAGIERLRAAFRPLGYRVHALSLEDVLHLKCVCAPLGDTAMTLVEGTLPVDAFDGVTLVEIPRAEGYAANCVAVGRRVIVAAGYPQTAARLEQAGFEVVPVDCSEMRKADGSLTCMSILL